MFSRRNDEGDFRCFSMRGVAGVIIPISVPITAGTAGGRRYFPIERG